MPEGKCMWTGQWTVSKKRKEERLRFGAHHSLWTTPSDIDYIINRIRSNCLFSFFVKCGSDILFRLAWDICEHTEKHIALREIKWWNQARPWSERTDAFVPNLPQWHGRITVALVQLCNRTQNNVPEFKSATPQISPAKIYRSFFLHNEHKLSKQLQHQIQA